MAKYKRISSDNKGKQAKEKKIIEKVIRKKCTNYGLAGIWTRSLRISYNGKYLNKRDAATQ